MNDKIKCAIYARVSTDKQGDSIENQIGQGKEYIARSLGDLYDSNDILVYKDEAVSGYYTSVFDRKEMKRAINDARNGLFKVLIFKEISRVGRDKQENPAIIGMFEQYGVRVIALNDNYDSLNKDNITFDILSVLSEQESKKTSARVSSAKKQKALRGQWNSTPPIGYVVDKNTKKLTIDEDSKHIPELIFELYVNKGMGSFKVSEVLNQRRIKTRNGNLWSRESVKRVLKNQAYIGNVVYGTKRNELVREYDDSGKMTKKKVQKRIDKSKWTIVEDAHEPIIDKSLFYAAQKILSERNHGRKPRRAYHPLTGILFCGKCGQGMVCQKRSYKQKQYRYYICKTYHKFGRSACDMANINADKLEDSILSVVENRVFDAVKNKKANANKDGDLKRIETEIKNKMKSIEKLQKDSKDLFEQRELFPEDLYKSQMLDIKKEIEVIQSEVDILDEQKLIVEKEGIEEESLDHYLNEFANIKNLNTEDIRRILHDLIKKVTIDNNDVHIEYYYFS